MKKEKILSLFFALPLVFIFFLSIFDFIYFQKALPNTYINGRNVSGKSYDELIEAIDEIRIPEKLIISASNNKEVTLNLSDLQIIKDNKKTAKRAVSIYKTGNILFDYYNIFSSLFKKTEIPIFIEIDKQELEEKTDQVLTILTTPPQYPKIKIEKDKITINPGKKGEVINKELLKAKIGQAISQEKEKIEIEVKEIDPTLSPSQVEILQKRAKKILNKEIVLLYEEEGKLFNLDSTTLGNFLNPYGGYKEEEIEKEVEEISKKVDRKPQNPIFKIAGEKIAVFKPAKEGVKVKKEELKKDIIENLKALEEKDDKEKTIKISVLKTPPDIKTEETNNLGIKELLGRGISYFRGSSPSRIHNIKLASSKLNGIIVKPGDVFSFNEAIGEVSQYQGYQPAYIIKEGRTVLGDGGGVCQVSTTLFRALLNAGFPIIERHPHSYRVSYYEQGFPPGLDATVFSPSVDLKFKNDTSQYILIQTEFNPQDLSLIFEIYGTKDGREVKISKPVIASTIAPPEDLYIDDPTLPVGTIKQIEHKAWGAKVYFDYQVKKGGEILFEKTFYSNYRPWQAVYLRGVGQ